MYSQILESMEKKYTELTGCVPSSAGDIGIRMKVLSHQLSLLYDSCAEIQNQCFPSTAVGQALEYHAMQKNMTRKPANSSKGNILFSRDTPATFNITIPKGNICQTDSVNGIIFATTQDGVINVGQTQVEVPAQSLDGGTDKNVAAGSINLFVTLVQGINSVTNLLPFTGGTDEEPDNELRERLLSSYRYTSNGANVAYYQKVALELPEIYSVQIIPRSGGRGKVAVVVAGKGVTLATSLLSRLREKYMLAKEIGVDVQVTSATLKKVDISIKVQSKNSENQSLLVQHIKHIVENALLEQKVGENLQLTSIYKALLQLGEVSNFVILNPTGDVNASLNELIVADNITVDFMENN